MINLKNQSLRRKAVLVIIAGIVVMLLLQAFVNSVVISRKLKAELNQRVLVNFENIYSLVNKHIGIMVSSGISMADLGIYYSRNFSRFGQNDVTEMMELVLVSRVSVLDSIFGMGLWYEPGVLGRGRKYTGPYAYRDGKDVRLTWQYSNKDYDYPSRPWYRIAVPGNGESLKKYYITSPYYDLLDGRHEVFITFAVPMMQRGKFIGVCTIDWGTESIARLLDGTGYTERSEVMLADIRSGLILYHRDHELLMKNMDQFSWYSKMRDRSLIEKTGSLSSVLMNGVSYDIFFRSTETGYLLITAVPSDEAYVLMKNMVIIFYVSAAVMAFFIILYVKGLMNKYLIKRIEIIEEGIKSVTEGDYSVSLDFPERDELTNIAESINGMSDTIRKRESDLLLLQQNLSGIFSAIPIAIVALDGRARITEWNRAAEIFTSVSAEEAKGQVFWDIFPEFEKYASIFSDAVNDGKTSVLANEMFDAVGRKYFDITAFPFSAENGMGCVFLVDDKTEMKEKENQLRMAQKMENLGTLAGGLAHDFNNILAGIMGTSSLISFLLKRGDAIDEVKLQDFAETIYSSAGRAADIVKRLLLLTKKQDTNYTPVDLNEIIVNIDSICRNTFDKRISIETEIPSSPAVVLGDAGQLEQSILNVCINSAHAMTVMRDRDSEPGGHLKIFVVPSQGRAPVHGEGHFEERYTFWEISVSDSGVGMDRTTRERIFEPFFSTKKPGLGTGLGLAMVYGIIKDHGGEIEISSSAGLGTVFRIFLPVHEGENVQENRVMQPDIIAGTGRILLVDDEINVAKAMKWMLESCGYEVVTAGDGDEALKIYHRETKNFDVVVLDYMLGSSTGLEVYSSIKSENPEAIVIFSSGYWVDDSLEKYLEDENTWFIQKPWDVNRLCTLIARAVGNRDK